jgi:hypothetical protein
MNAPVESKLLPCPDGHKTVEVTEWPAHGDTWKWFGRCTCCGWRLGGFATREQAITAWNTRNQVAELVEALKRAKWLFAQIGQMHSTDHGDVGERCMELGQRGHSETKAALASHKGEQP